MLSTIRQPESRAKCQIRSEKRGKKMFRLLECEDTIFYSLKRGCDSAADDTN